MQNQGLSSLPAKSNDSSKEKSTLSRAAESLRKRVGDSKEYEVVSETAKEETKKPIFESWIWGAEYNDALYLESELIKQYQGKSLEDAISGRVVSNEQGECYSISASCTSNFKLASYDESRRHIISDLKVLSGIGPVSEQTLKRKGYKTVEDLKRHPRWKKQARDFMQMIDRKEVDSMQKLLWQASPKIASATPLFSGILPRSRLRHSRHRNPGIIRETNNLAGHSKTK